MVSQVTLGNFFTTSNGKTVLGGAGGSGLDTQALLKSLVDAKGLPATQDQTRIDTNNKQVSALNTFQSLLSNFQSASDALRNAPGVGNDANNAFKFTTASVTSDTGTASNYLTVSTSPGATLQSYQISNVTNLASSASQNTGVFTVTSADASVVPPLSGSVQFGAGTITINSQDITIDSGDSLNNIAAKFNAVSGTTGINATVIQIDSTHFELSFSATATGTANNFDLTNSGTVSDPSGVLTATGVGVAASQTSGPYTLASAGDPIVSASPIGGTANQFAPGTITVNGQSITLSEGDSLTTVAGAFNAVQTASGIHADVVDNGNGTFSLAFTSTSPGPTHNFDLTSGSTVTDPGGVLTGAGIGAAVAGTTTATAGSDASFDINGVTVTRSSNVISDVISGVTFNLLQKTLGATLTVNVQPDTSTVQNSIVNFVKAYNAIKTFAATQTQLNSDGTYADTAILANNTTFRATMSDLTSQINSQVSGLADGALNSLASLGITLTTQPASDTNPSVSNILTVDDGKLTSALATNFAGVRAVFGLTESSNNTNVRVFSATNALGVTQLTLNAVPSTNTFTATYDLGDGPVTVNLTATALPGDSGYSLAGPSDGPLQGLVLLYASTSSGTATITMTQGIAAQQYNTMNAALTYSTGTMAVALKGLQDNNTRLNDDIAQVNQQVSLYQNQMLAKFAALEKAISSINTLLQSLSANQNAALVASSH